MLFTLASGVGLAALPVTSEFCISLPNRQRYTLTSTHDLPKLAQDLDQLIQDEEQFLAQRKAVQKRQRADKPLAEMSQAQLRSFYAEPLDLPTGNELRGLRELHLLCGQLNAASKPEARIHTMRFMIEVARSIQCSRPSLIIS